MTNLFGGELESAIRFARSFLPQLATGRSAAPNEQNMGRICELTCGAFVWGKGAPQIPPLRSPEFLSRLVALADFMRSSLEKTAHVDLFRAT
jgi:hypothetical protein